MDKVLLDNDVINVFADIKKNNVNIFKTFFNDFQKNPQINQFIYDNEILLNKSFVDALINDDFLNVIKYNDYIDDITQVIYIENFKEMYHLLNKEEIDEKHIFIRCSGKNMGEIHSILCAFLLNIAIFMSNDGHSKLLQNHLNSGRNSLQVYRIADSCREVAGREIHTIKKKQLDNITRCCNQKEKQEISNIWNSR